MRQSYELAFRGTEDGKDWIAANLPQGAGLGSKQHEMAYELAKELKLSLGSQFAGITGHSLGGGLAAVAAMATGVSASTFNAAGVHTDTFKSLQINPDYKRAEGLINNYRVRGELLTNLQEYGAIGGIPLALLGPAGLALAAVGVAMPNALGRQHTIEAFAPNENAMPWLARNNVITGGLPAFDLHGMDYVMRGVLLTNRSVGAL